MKIKFAYSPSPELLMTVVRSIPTLDSGSIVMVVHSLTEIVGHVRWGSVLIAMVVRSTAGSKVPVEYASRLAASAAVHLEH